MNWSKEPSSKEKMFCFIKRFVDSAISSSSESLAALSRAASTVGSVNETSRRCGPCQSCIPWLNPLRCTSKSSSSYPTHHIYKGITTFQTTRHNFTTKLPKLCSFMSWILTAIKHEKNLIIILAIYVTHS